MMNIAWLLEEYPMSVQTFIAREIKRMRERGFNVQIWAVCAGEGAIQLPRTSRGSALRTAANEIVRGNWEERPSFWRAKGMTWVSECRKELQNVEWIHSGWSSYTAWIAYEAARQLDTPWSFTAHARDLWVAGGDLTAKLQEAQIAFSCTHAGVEQLRRLAPDSKSAKVIYAPHGLAVRDFPFALWQPSADGVYRVLSIGRLVPKKGFDLLLSAIAHLLAQNCRVEARIFGEGPERDELEAQIARLNLSNAVRLEGALKPSLVAGVMSQAAQEGAVFALPCRVAEDGDRDGLPNVLLEAAACGLPLVTTEAASVGDFVDDTTGSLCRPNDALALAQSLRAAWDNPEQTRHRCVTARSRVEAEHDVAHTTEVMAQTFLSAQSK